VRDKVKQTGPHPAINKHHNKLPCVRSLHQERGSRWPDLTDDCSLHAGRHQSPQGHTHHAIRQCLCLDSSMPAVPHMLTQRRPAMPAALTPLAPQHGCCCQCVCQHIFKGTALSSLTLRAQWVPPLPGQTAMTQTDQTRLWWLNHPSP